MEHLPNVILLFLRRIDGVSHVVHLKLTRRPEGQVVGLRRPEPDATDLIGFKVDGEMSASCLRQLL